MSFLADSCTFTVLTKEVIDASHDFNCGHDDLNEFFRIDCINYSQQLLGKTYCFLLDEDPKLMSWMKLHTPNGEVPAAEVCGDTATFLVSDSAKHIHGQMILIDGGMSVWQQPDLP